MNPAQWLVKNLLFIVVSIFFRDMDGLNVDKLTDDPMILVCAPHANQFLDPIMVQATSGKDIGFLAAAVSMKRRFVGAAARAMRSIPVARPQDLAKKGSGTIRVEETKVTGTQTLFKKEAEVGSTISIAGKSLLVSEVLSDTELIVKGPGVSEAIPDSSYKIIPKVDQSEVYDSVTEVLYKGGCIGIFPEGGSHDRTELLPLKAGFTIMALGALVKHPELKLKIVPVGLNYFRAHAFRSAAYVDFGAPISIPPELVEKYKQGGEQKREACATLLEMVNEGIKAVTVSAPDYETLQMFQAARRLYKPSGLKLTPQQKLVLNRSFSMGYARFKDDPKVQAFRDQFLEYRQTIKQLGLQDHQIKRIRHNKCSSFFLLITRGLMLGFLLLLSIPGLILTLPITIAAVQIPKKKAKEAKAASSVKIAGRDVLATWKVFVGLGLVPLHWFLYTAAVVLIIIFLGRPSLPLWAQIVIPIGSFFMIPLIFYSTVIFVERSRAIFLSLTPLFLACFNSETGNQLQSKRIQLQKQLRELVDELGPSFAEDFEKSRVIHPEQFDQKGKHHKDGPKEAPKDARKEGKAEKDDQVYANPLFEAHPQDGGLATEDSNEILVKEESS